MHKNHNSRHHTFGVIPLCSFSYLNFFPDSNSRSIRATDLKFHRQIDLIEENGNEKEL